MKPIKHEGCNVVMGKDQPEYFDLPSFRSGGNRGDVITCWGLTWKERWKILFTGQMWLNCWTFQKPLTPVRMSTENLYEEFLQEVHDTVEAEEKGG